MTTHELARMLTHLRDAFGPSLKTDAVQGMTDAANAFQSLPEKSLKEVVKDMQKTAGSASLLVEQILAAKQGNGAADAVIAAVQKLKGDDLKAVLSALHLPKKGKVPDQKATITAFIKAAPHLPDIHGDAEAIEAAYGLYQDLSRSNLDIHELRERFQPLREAGKTILIGVAEKLRHRTDGSREEIANRLLNTLEGLCVSRVKNELIGAAH